MTKIKCKTGTTIKAFSGAKFSLSLRREDLNGPSFNPAPAVTKLYGLGEDF